MHPNEPHLPVAPDAISHCWDSQKGRCLAGCDELGADHPAMPIAHSQSYLLGLLNSDEWTIAGMELLIRGEG